MFRIFQIIIVGIAFGFGFYNLDRQESPASLSSIHEKIILKVPEPKAEPGPKLTEILIPEKIKVPLEIILDDAYSVAYAESLRTGKNLVCWIGYACKSSEKQITDVLHCHVDELPPFRAPCVVVAIPRNGILERSAVIPSDEVSASTIKAACQGNYNKSQINGGKHGGG